MELFKSPAEALLFALRFSSQQYAASPMARMMRQGTASSGSDKGMVGLDGAGQAGLVQARIEKLDPLERACIIARYANRDEECKCCGGTKPTDEYKGAIITLADWAEQFIASASARRMRYAIVQEFYERRRALTAEAAKINVPKRTAYDQKDKIWPHLSSLDKRAQEVIGDMLHDMCGEVA